MSKDSTKLKFGTITGSTDTTQTVATDSSNVSTSESTVRSTTVATNSSTVGSVVSSKVLVGSNLVSGTTRPLAEANTSEMDMEVDVGSSSKRANTHMTTGVRESRNTARTELAKTKSASAKKTTVATGNSEVSTVASTLDSTVTSTLDSTVASTVASKVATDSSRIIEAQTVQSIERVAIDTAHIHFPDSTQKAISRLNGCVQKLEVENTGLKQAAIDLKNRLQWEQQCTANFQRLTAQKETLQAQNDQLKLLANELKRRLCTKQQREQQWAATVQRLTSQNESLRREKNEFKQHANELREQQCAATIQRVSSQNKLITQLAKGLFHATYVATGSQLALTLELLDTVVSETREPFPRETIKCLTRSRYRASFSELKGTSTTKKTIHSAKVAIGLLLRSKERLEEFRRTVGEMCMDTTDVSVSVAGIKVGNTSIGATLPQMRSAVSSASVGPPHKRRRVPQSALSPVTAVALSPLGSGLPVAGRPRSVALPVLSPMRASTRDPKDVSTTKATAEKRTFQEQNATDTNDT